MPMIIETAVAMLSCARIGAIHSKVFGGFSSEELASRIVDCKPKLIVSASCGLEPHKIIDYPSLIREAIKIAQVPGLPVIYFDRTQMPVKSLESTESLWQNEVASAQAAPAVDVDSSHPLYILYTSGTTGKPKGIYRGTGDTAVGVMLSLEYGFGFTRDSKIFATSDLGWVVGHSYIVYGPLLFGGTSVIYEGKPVGTPDASAYFKIVEKYRIDILYSSPTAMRSLRKEDPEGELILKSDLSSLKVFGVVGERTDKYTYGFVKKIMPANCLYNDTYWQTETGWFLCANFIKPKRFPTKGGSCTKPFPGYQVKIFTDEGETIDQANVMGHVVVKLPMPPGFMLSIWGNEPMFKEKYLEKFPGYYLTGDAGYYDSDGYVHIMTRTDDVIQVAGHRLSTGQMEECLLSHKDLAEAVVVGINDQLKGQSPFGIIVLKVGHERVKEELFKELIQIVRTKIGPIACLNTFAVVEKLPKTRSGKLLRGTIRKILDHEEYQMPSTIEDPETLKAIQEIANQAKIQNDIQFDNLEELDLQKLKIE